MAPKKKDKAQREREYEDKKYLISRIAAACRDIRNQIRDPKEISNNRPNWLSDKDHEFINEKLAKAKTILRLDLSDEALQTVECPSMEALKERWVKEQGGLSLAMQSLTAHLQWLAFADLQRQLRETLMGMIGIRPVLESDDVTVSIRQLLHADPRTEVVNWDKIWDTTKYDKDRRDAVLRTLFGGHENSLQRQSDTCLRSYLMSRGDNNKVILPLLKPVEGPGGVDVSNMEFTDEIVRPLIRGCWEIRMLHRDKAQKQLENSALLKKFEEQSAETRKRERVEKEERESQRVEKELKEREEKLQHDL